MKGCTDHKEAQSCNRACHYCPYYLGNSEVEDVEQPVDDDEVEDDQEDGEEDEEITPERVERALKMLNMML